MEEPFLQVLHVSTDSQRLDLDHSELIKTEAEVEIYHRIRGQDQYEQTAENAFLSRHMRDVNTIDLFHDLLVLASLVTISSRTEIADPAALKAYICFFTLVWFTWLQSVLFDIRFSTESIPHYASKAVSCAMMSMFVVCAATYDLIGIESNADGPRVLSLILMVSRATLALQYSVAHCRALDHKETRFSSLFTMMGLTCSALAFLRVSLGMPSDFERFSTWYIVCAMEIVSTVALFWEWKVDKIKTTRLFDRLGMLTVVILAKGVLALSRATYRLSAELNWTAADHYSELVSAILLMYFIATLCFKNVKYDNLDSFRQPLWMILHYPLHTAILLIMEGSSLLMLLKTVTQISRAWENLHPLHDYPDWKTFFAGYLTEREVVSDIRQDMDTIFGATFRNAASFFKWYDYNLNIDEVKDIASPFNSPTWQAEAAGKINQLWIGIERTIFARFGIDECAISDCTSPSFGKNVDQQHGMDAIHRLFYISAGSLLLILALMYTPSIGNNIHKQKTWLSIAIKSTVAISFLIPISSNWVHGESSNARFFDPWTMAVVTFGYFTVTACDHWIYSSACPKRSSAYPSPPEYVEHV